MTIQENVPLAPLTTLQVGGSARYFAELRREDEVREAVHFSVGAGVNWDDFVAQAVVQNCAGVECLSGIPGSVGGTPVQNVGAYGQEVADTIESVRALDLKEDRIVVLPKPAC